MQEVIIFNKINQHPQFRYSGADLARVTGLDKSLISRFLNGKTDISLSKFFILIQGMPVEFQQAYWEEFLGYKVDLSRDRIPWTELISSASCSDLEEILNAIANRWSQLTGNRDSKEEAYLAR